MKLLPRARAPALALGGTFALVRPGWPGARADASTERTLCSNSGCRCRWFAKRRRLRGQQGLTPCCRQPVLWAGGCVGRTSLRARRRLKHSPARSLWAGGSKRRSWFARKRPGYIRRPLSFRVTIAPNRANRCRQGAEPPRCSCAPLPALCAETYGNEVRRCTRRLTS